MHLFSGSLFLTVVFLFNGLHYSESAKLPDTFKQCKPSDPDIDKCLKTAVETAIRVMAKGIPSLQLLPVDPLAVSKISIQQGGNRPVNVKLDLADTTLKGIKDVVVTNVRSDLSKQFYDIDVEIPYLQLDGDYEMDGKFLLIPLKGKGKCTMSLDKPKVNFKVKADLKTKNGEDFWEAKSVDILVKENKKFQVNFENLFNGDKLLGETTNKALNDNWEGFWDELRPTLQDTFGAVFVQVANVIFSKVSVKDMFLD